jgi:hypothetical protein
LLYKTGERGYDINGAKRAPGHYSFIAEKEQTMAAARLRLDREVISQDQTALQRVAELSDYQPLKSEFGIEALRILEAAMIEARQAENRLRYEAEVAQERAITLTRAFHEAIKGMKAQVLAQYGEDSMALHAVGWKRRSERRPPTRRPQAV